MDAQDKRLVDALTDAIRECSDLIVREAGSANVPANPLVAEPLPSLLDQCRLVVKETARQPEPVRTLHHLACTGGTLIAKCIASMPNTQLLSEVEPHSPIPQTRRSKFAPTDVIGLLRNSSRGSDSELESKIFMAALEPLYEDCARKGLRLVMRDHAHSTYCTGPSVLESPNLRQLLSERYAVRSVVTVRHPLDSWLSLKHNEWVHFEPGTLDEYAARYLRFIADHEGLEIFRYEDFVDAPEQELEKICAALDIPYREGFQDLLPVHRFSGDSGRSSDFIGPRHRRTVPESVAEDARDSQSYKRICSRLGYDSDA